jgi:hypothetical protein
MRLVNPPPMFRYYANNLQDLENRLLEWRAEAQGIMMDMDDDLQCMTECKFRAALNGLLEEFKILDSHIQSCTSEMAEYSSYLEGIEAQYEEAGMN